MLSNRLLAFDVRGAASRKAKDAINAQLVRMHTVQRSRLFSPRHAAL